MAQFVESQAGCSSADTDYGYSSVSPAEWEQALQAAEAMLGMSAGTAPQAPIPDPPAAPQLLLPVVDRVERQHDELHEYPEGLVDIPENDKKQTSRVVFTINNPGEYRPVFDASKMAYLVWQLERGENGTLHIQGYMRLKKRLRFRQIQPLLGGHAAVFVARGNEEQCRTYCTKEDTRVEPGEEHGDYDPLAGKQGHRSDLDDIAKMLIAGQKLKAIATAHPAAVARYASGIQLLQELLAPQPPIAREVEVLVLWGGGNLGKTHRVMMNEGLWNAGGIYCVIPGRGPFDMYQGEATLFFDEFDWRAWDIFLMNRIMDKWARIHMDARFHNKSVAWTRVIICANKSPETWYPYADLEVLQAFRRRLRDGCRHITSRDEDITELPPDPEFDKDGELVVPGVRRADFPPTHPPAAAAAGQPSASILVPDSQPPSPTQMQ